MQHIHLIAIGGSAMHNLAIALHKKGYEITGSDDEIFEPSKSRLELYGLLPKKEGWDTSLITENISAVIVGMHARKDNPELLKAQEIGLKIYSYPEYLYEQTRGKKRVVIGGSHGKTTVTSMIMHVLKENRITFDYMVGAQVKGFDEMVGLFSDTKVAVFEGDEYLSSPLDPRPKFHLYRPDIAVVTGIAWDHINVFPTFDIYLEQFRKFLFCIEPEGKLFYYRGDKHMSKLVEKFSDRFFCQSYDTFSHEVICDKTILLGEGKKYPIKVFGKHNLQNISAAYFICKELGVPAHKILHAIQSFEGASRRLQKLVDSACSTVFQDFAHSPSKVGATVAAVKKQFGKRKLIAVLELHTFSSLNGKFLGEYMATMDGPEQAVVYYSSDTLLHKKMETLDPEMVKKAFGRKDLIVINEKEKLKQFFLGLELNNSNLLLMSSGNWSGIDIYDMAEFLHNKCD